MEKFTTFKLPTLIDMETDFTDYCKSVLPKYSKTKEFEDFKKIILLIKGEIKRRQRLLNREVVV